MKQIRKGIFETNSSSTHSIAIGKNKVPDVKGRSIYFAFGDWGWEKGCETDTASYLYTAIVDSSFSDYEFNERMSRLKSALDRLGVTYEFAKGKKSFCSIDHSSECSDLIEALLSDDDLLARYLFGDSCIYTGNDNNCDYFNMCNCADAYVWDDDGNKIPNPNHDPENYDYFYKGN